MKVNRYALVEPEQQRYRCLQRLMLRWWRNEQSDERYLVAATDHADLDRRQRTLERMTAGPAFATFNHGLAIAARLPAPAERQNVTRRAATGHREAATRNGRRESYVPVA